MVERREAPDSRPEKEVRSQRPRRTHPERVEDRASAPNDESTLESEETREEAPDPELRVPSYLSFAQLGFASAAITVADVAAPTADAGEGLNGFAFGSVSSAEAVDLPDHLIPITRELADLIADLAEADLAIAQPSDAEATPALEGDDATLIAEPLETLASAEAHVASPKIMRHEALTSGLHLQWSSEQASANEAIADDQIELEADRAVEDTSSEARTDSNRRVDARAVAANGNASTAGGNSGGHPQQHSGQQPDAFVTAPEAGLELGANTDAATFSSLAASAASTASASETPAGPAATVSRLVVRATELMDARRMESRRLSISLPTEDGSPVRLTISPDVRGGHRVALVVASTQIRDGLRRARAEIEESISKLPLRVSEISIETAAGDPALPNPSALRAEARKRNTSW